MVLTKLTNVSYAKVNRTGHKGHPCLMPQCKGIGSEKLKTETTLANKALVFTWDRSEERGDEIKWF